MGGGHPTSLIGGDAIIIFYGNTKFIFIIYDVFNLAMKVIRELKSFLTAEEAVELFDVLSNLNNVAHAHLTEGCYARTHIMCRHLDELGYAPNKAWLIEDRAKTMLPSIPGPENDGDLNFTYHVAPALLVERPDGQIVDMVFDPSFFDGPTEMDEWAFVMDEDPPYVEIKPFGEAPSGYKHDYKIIDKPMSSSASADDHAKQLMQDHEQSLSRAGFEGQRRCVFESQLRSGLKTDALSSEFGKAHDPLIEVVSPPIRDRVRPKRYWEMDADELDAYYDS